MAMPHSPPLILPACLIVILATFIAAPTPSSAQCTTAANQAFASCVDLQPSTLAWTLVPTNSTLSLAYTDTALSTSGWVGWGINLNGTSMVGSHALIAFRRANGTPAALPYELTAAIYRDSSVPLRPASLDTFAGGQLGLESLSASTTDLTFTVLATVRLPAGVTKINTVYNRGPSVGAGDVPAPHGVGQRNGMRSVDLATGAVSSAGAGPRAGLKNIHGILAAASWGVATILGAMAARYLRAAEPAWFYLHVALQTGAYLVGISAWAIGLRLGALSPGVTHYSHRNVGISVAVMASVQVIALFARPGPQHSLRTYWNIYHHSLGYTIIILGVVNVFKGFAILSPPVKYKVIYIAFLVVAACVSLAMEALTWSQFFRRKKEEQKLKRSGVNRDSANGGSAATQLAGPTKWDDEEV